VEAWLKTRVKNKSYANNDETKIVLDLVKKYMEDGALFDTLDKNFSQIMGTNNSIKITSFINIMTALLVPYTMQSIERALYEKIFIFSMCWGICGLFDPEKREQFHKWLEERKAPLPSISAPKMVASERENVFDFLVHKDSSNWKTYDPEKWEKPKKFAFSQILIPTVDSTRSAYLIKMIQNLEISAFCTRSVLIVGAMGTAKTSSILMYCQKLDEKSAFKRINFSSATSPFNFQCSIDAEVEKRTARTYEPPGGKKLVVFIDDMSMPVVNVWGDQVTLEIVRQLIDQQGFYFLTKDQRGEFKQINNLLFI